ncbi:acetyl-CoA C-acyltransferase [Pseudarthrobacter sp. AG30]|uniref:acetyl-CoA C-acyltransferase n=1 Tax=Pseudarthrobacter sp. AG30 TaxID=2249742 RepID=UPI000D6E32BD|nr:acetyl-CoA C-acyltransferase [Pseudarthrobacter sp. AG30]RAX14758.1 acetyl-CoA C-acyltransferase [Pseudarthrobacter sp. AG30]
MTAESPQQRPRTALIAGYARTPFVRFGGKFSKVPAVNLGAHAAAAALRRAGVSPKDVQRVVAGHVLQGGAGQNPARQTAIGARIPYSVPALTINAVCLSGMEAVVEASRLISSGEAEIVLAVGQESMSLAPHVLGARAGQKYGAMELVDTLERDGLTDAFEGCSMGVLTDNSNADLGISRSDQDILAAASHRRAATHSDFQAGEIEPYILTSRGNDIVVAQDDGIRPDATAESLATLRPAFAPEGTVTAGNASQITDGAAALVLVSQEAAQRLGLSPLAAVESHAMVSGPDIRLHSQPANAILAALKKTDISPADLSAIEINEAFAAVVVQSIDDLGVDAQIVNSRGGAVALGHPIGASGARIVGTLARQLVESGPGSFGAAGICGGGGQGSAVLLRAI